MDKQNAVHEYNGTLFSPKEEWMNRATRWMNLENIILNGRSQTQKATLYDSGMSRIGKSIEMESRFVVFRGCGEGEWGVSPSVDGISFRGDEMFCDLIVLMVVSITL